MIVDKHRPQLRHKLREATNHFKCVTADGEQMVLDKEIELNVELDGQTVTIKLSELPVQCPISSVRKTVKRGDMVVFQNQEGYIVHKANYRKIYVVDRDGVYFVRMKLPGCITKDVESNESGFSRPGR